MPTPINRRLSRRRTLQLFAASAAIAGASAAAPLDALHRWRGIALGADAEMSLYCESAKEAAQLFDMAADEIDRLEAIFSLYRGDSALSRLNRDGRLPAPPPELLEVLTIAGAIHRATGGAFDPAVQALWAYQAEIAAGIAKPDAVRLAALVEQGGWRRVSISTDAIKLASPAALLTLNGIAQGYITDRVAALMRAHGMANILIDLGEISALGRRDGVSPWRVGIAGEGDAPAMEIALEDISIATSAPSATTFDQSGKLGHIIDPRTGAPAQMRWRQASVIHPSAAIADALSTGLVMLDRAEMQAALAQFPAAGLVAFDYAGAHFRLAPTN